MREFSRELISSYFAPEGPVKNSIQNYVFRQEQVNLAAAVAHAFVNKEFLLAEVGTGVGKTYAYLLPAILWSLQEGEKVVVSTRTKALQQQLVEGDLPDMQKAVGKLSFVEAKGRENYLCWSKYLDILGGRKALDENEQEFVQSVLYWAETTKTGDRKELGLPGFAMKNWHLLAADRKSCRLDLCKYRDKCFRLKMLRSMEKANVIVVNHALLLSDLLLENSILPEYKYLVVDEAHNFDRESFDKLSTVFSYDEISELLNRLYYRDKKFERGYMQYLKTRYPHIIKQLNDISSLIYSCQEFTEDFFGQITSASANNENNYSKVLEVGEFEDPRLSGAVDVYLDWQHSINLLFNKLNELKKELSGNDEEFELNGMILSLQEHSSRAFKVMEEDLGKPDHITWIEYRNKKGISLCSSSVSIGNILHNRLYSNLESLIMVSATLAIENRFDYFIDKTGLRELASCDRVNTLLEFSPFNYDKQAVMLAVKNMPEPSWNTFGREMVKLLGDIILATRGRTLILFTARKQLQEASIALRKLAESQGIKLLVQDEDGEFAVLLEEFSKGQNRVLMGLETFWEGIDLQGDILKYLVITRLPFRSPADPFCSAGDRHYRMLKQNSFKSFMLPDAAVRFKQGTGRLIRSENDRGVVIVMDSRLESKPYGRVFKNSIPIKNVVAVKKEELTVFLRKYL